jgi:hypothetical protein
VVSCQCCPAGLWGQKNKILTADYADFADKPNNVIKLVGTIINNVKFNMFIL